MPIEIERKYLVHQDKWKALPKEDGQHYRQGYISNDPDKTIRVRVGNNEGYLTIKGRSVGAARPEYEYAIPRQDVIELLDNFCTSDISKVRYRIPYNGKVWEVDEFLGHNEGLIIAEIELESEEDVFDLPDWVAKEVTGEEKYYNANLSTHPYKDWKESS